MGFLRNFWYCAAWSDEVGSAPLGRKLLGESLVLYRKTDNSIAALGDVCPHRFAPLHLGKVIGDAIACPYHGLRFESDGRCSHNPHGEIIPPTLKVSAYPIVERYGVAWIWMGDPGLADDRDIPVLHGHDDPGFRVVHGVIPVPGAFELVSDNLLDLSHAQYLHSALATEQDALQRDVFNVNQDGDSVVTVNNTLNTRKFPFAQLVWPDGPERIDTYSGLRWQAPANMLLKVNFTAAGASEADGMHGWGAELATPETETSCHYFWSFARDYRLEDTALSETLAKVIAGVFSGEDAWMIGKVQEMMGDETDLFELRPVILPTDAAAVRARRIIRRIVREAEQQPHDPALA